MKRGPKRLQTQPQQSSGPGEVGRGAGGWVAALRALAEKEYILIFFKKK